MLRWRELLGEAEQRLAAAGLGNAANEARLVVEQASGYEGAELALVLDEPATQRGVASADAMVGRRLAGEPLQYVLGSWGFRTLDLFVDRRVLIPRPETEVVAGCALVELDRWSGRHGGDGEPPVVVDLGTGSGAIALAIASERDGVEVWATDASVDAIAVARANLSGLGRPAARVRIVEGSWFEALPHELRGAVGVIVSNPPYIASSDELPAEVADWEPTSALVAGPKGTEDLELILGEAPGWLAPGGSAVLELAPHQAEEMVQVATRAGFARVEVLEDLAGRLRVLVARLA